MPYVCPLDTFTTPDRITFLEHVSQAHPETPFYPCSYCEGLFASEEALTAHVVEAHPGVSHTQTAGMLEIANMISRHGARPVTADRPYSGVLHGLVKGEFDAFTGGITPPPGASKSPITPEEGAQAASGWSAAALTGIAAANVIGILAEAASFGQVETVMYAIQSVLDALGAKDVARALIGIPWQQGIVKAAQYHYNRVYLPMIPELRDLITMRIRGLIDESTFTLQASYLGYKGDWSTKLRDASYVAPGVGELMQMKWRGLLTPPQIDRSMAQLGIDPTYWYYLHVITDRIPDVRDLTEMYWRGRIGEDQFASDLIKQGWRDPYLAGYRELARRVPGPMDLIRFYVREAYVPEMQLEIPDAFINDMKLQGYEERWTRLFWGAHWVLVPVGQLYDMYHRRIIDYNTLVEQLKFHDFTSPWRSRLIQTAYRVWRLLDLRYGWQLGLLTDSGLIDKLLDYGYSPQDAPNIAKVHMERVLETHKMTYARAVAQGYRKGIYTREQAITKMRSVQVIDPIIGYMLNAEEVKREIGAIEPDEEPRILTASQVLQAFREGVFTRETALTRLIGMGYSEEDARILVAINTPEPPPVEEPKPRTLLTGQILQAFRGAVYTKEETKARLMALNYSAEDADTLIEVSTPKPPPPEVPKYSTLTASQILSAYRNGVFTREMASARLGILGYPDTDAEILLDLNTPKQPVTEPTSKMVTAASTLYKEGLMPLDEFEGWLRKANLSEEEIRIETDVQNLRYRYDLTADIIASQKDAFQKDLITEDQLYEGLINLGMQPERARVLVAAQVIKKLPRPKAA